MLTKKEIELVEEIIKGKSNKEIAYDLQKSEKTIKNQITTIFKKMEVQSRTEMAFAVLKKESVGKMLEKIREDICDNYCKYRDTSDEEELCDVIRDGRECPLDRLC
ncbi:MAG: LuxR C-terminal-related transcriptional regulator [Flavobacterium sp.]